MRSKLAAFLQDYDGTHVAVLQEARQACREDSGYLEALVALCFDAEPRVSDAATWILKADLEAGVALEPPLIDLMAASLGGLQAWPAQLHMCQCFEYLTCDLTQAERFFHWAETLTRHPRPFLRAWSLTVMVLVGREIEGFRGEAERALAAAQTDKAASVRARVRHLSERLQSS